MKLQSNFLYLIFFLLFLKGTNAQKNQMILKGKVMNWPTDTLFMQTMPFYSPFSSTLKSQVIKKDNNFCFELFGIGPIIVQLYANRAMAAYHKAQLLFLNYSTNYYYGHCKNYYTDYVATFLLEPGKQLEITLKAADHTDTFKKQFTKIEAEKKVEKPRKIEIIFSGENKTAQEYFQKTFVMQDKVDKRLELYTNQPLEKLVAGYEKIRNKLLTVLENEKEKLSTVLFEYIKAEIEFGARVEFMKHLMFSNKEEPGILDSFFSNKISQKVVEIIRFNKEEVTEVVLASEAYNKFVELFLNFNINIQNKKFSSTNSFSKQKCKTVIRLLPQKSAYYYLAGHLLQTHRTEDFIENLIIATIKKFPDGELNDKLMAKYEL